MLSVSTVVRLQNTEGNFIFLLLFMNRWYTPFLKPINLSKLCARLGILFNEIESKNDFGQKLHSKKNIQFSTTLQLLFFEKQYALD